MSQLKLNYSQASTEASVISANADLVKTTLASIVSAMDNIGSSDDWSGQAAQRFKNKFNECSDTFNSFYNELKTVQNKVESTAQTINKLDNN